MTTIAKTLAGIVKTLNEIRSDIASMNSEYVSGKIGVAHFLCYKQSNKDIEDIIQHLNGYPVGRKTLYKKSDIMAVLEGEK